MEVRSTISSWAAFTTAPDSETSQSSPSTALDFLVSIATAGITIHSSTGALGIGKLENLTVGRGASAFVQRGQTGNGRIVAVKQAVLSPVSLRTSDRKNFEQYLRQICLELRILTQKRIKAHANIIDIVGLCWDEFSGRPYLALVLEYSSYGTLKTFLQSHLDLSDTILISLAAQVAAGLEALHEHKICHGDVKTENALIFLDGESRRVKISDFSGAIIYATGGSTGRVDCGWGTHLLNAPEIRTGAAMRVETYSIHDAILTDVYSFGLLVWETLKHGQSYFDKHWCSSDGRSSDLDSMERYLDSLTHNGLLKKASEFARHRITDATMVDCILQVFEGSLQDNAQQRVSMSEIQRTLEKVEPSKELCIHDKNEGSDAFDLGAWDTDCTILDLFRHGSINGVLLDTMPYHIQSRIVTELEILATAPDIAQASKSHAALCLSECHNLGFGVQYDKIKCIEWIKEAAVLGSAKAIAWFNRICFANSISSMAEEKEPAAPSFEEQLSQYAVEDYLSQRVRLQITATKQLHMESKMSSGPSASTDLPQPHFHVRLFKSHSFDEISPLHAASFVGDDKQVMDLLKVVDADQVSSGGLTATHYACLGGHLSTLALLLKSNASTSETDSHGCTPLHFTFGFLESEASEAVALLLQHGANPKAIMTSSIKWEYHDIVLTGDPLQCAVRTRNHALIAALLPSATRYNCLEDAILCGFWEVVEKLILHFGIDHEYPLEFYFRPRIETASHWIAHGPDWSKAMGKTIGLIQKYSLNRAHHTMPPLLPYILDTNLHDQLELIDICLDIFPESEIKRTTDSGLSALGYAISQAKNQTKWKGIIEKFVSKHTITELEVEVINSGSYLHLAVLSDSITAAHVLLEKGVRVDQHTFDGSEITPLEVCMVLQKSTEMFSLLVEYGADICKRNSNSGGTLYQDALVSLPKTSDILEAALRDLRIDVDVVETLHGSLHAVFALQPEHRRDTLDAFRFFLGTPDAFKYLDSMDKKGMTMVQKAAYFLHSESLALLLEAGADANVPYVCPENGIHLLPLQIVCAWGRLLWWDYKVNQEPQVSTRQQRNRECAFKVATELLEWHRVRPNNPFEKITKLHLAYCIGDDSEVARLITAGFSKDLEVKACWPGMNCEVLPEELASADLEKEVVALASLRLVGLGVTPESTTLWG